MKLKIYEKESISNGIKSYSYIIPIKGNHGIEVDYGIYDINLELADKDFGEERYINIRPGELYTLELNQKLNLVLQLIYLDGKLMVNIYEGTKLIDWEICGIYLV